MIVKKKENCREGGQRSWFLCTLDFASLEARLAAVDTFYNQCPNKAITDFKNCPYDPDETLYNVYKDGSKTSDMHSMTGYGTFVGSVNMDAIRVHDDVDSRDYVFAPTSRCKVKRGDKEEIVFASDLQPFDHIIEHMKK